MSIVIYAAVLLLFSAEAVEYSQENEGYAQGFMPICPGYKKPADIKPERLKNIKISVLGKGSIWQAKWTSYNYDAIKSLAMDPEIDFNRKTVVYAPGYMESIALPVGRVIMVVYKQLGYNVLILEYVEFTTNIFPVNQLHSYKTVTINHINCTEMTAGIGLFQFEMDYNHLISRVSHFYNQNPTYSTLRVVRLARPIGKHIAEMLASLTTLGLDPKKLELVGLSLGGVTMPFIAKNFRRITGRNISAITALDPAGPCLRHAGPEDRLDPSDADFVLSIATNIAGYGTAIPVGHMTVFVNGGEFQSGVLPSILCDNVCSHIHAILVWRSALQHPGSFIALQCDSMQQARDHKCHERTPMVTNTLDLYTDRSKPGIYYLATTHTFPFYLGKEGLKRNGSKMLNHINKLNAVDVLRV